MSGNFPRKSRLVQLRGIRLRRITLLDDLDFWIGSWYVLTTVFVHLGYCVARFQLVLKGFKTYNLILR